MNISLNYIMEIIIHNKYIRDDYPHIKDRYLCLVHSTLIDPLRIIQYVFEQNPNLNLLKPLDNNLPSSTLSLYAICYICIAMDPTLNFDTELGNLYTTIVHKLIEDDGSAKRYIDNLLRTSTNNFINRDYKCQCQFTLSFNEKSIEKYKIGNRIDLLQKFLSGADFENCVDVEESVQTIIQTIQNNLRKSKKVIIKKKLEDVPKYLWTDIFEKYYQHQKKPIYIRSGDNLVYRKKEDDYSESDEESEEESGKHEGDTIYLYLNEPEPDPDSLVIFQDQPYCILCDDNNPPSFTEAKFFNGHVRTNKVVKTKPYICRQICSSLAHCYYQGFPGNKHKISIKNLRYVKNQVMALYVGYLDTNSDFNVFYIDIIKFIIGKFLDIVAGYRY